MQHVHVEVHINAPIDKVFETICDHEHFIFTPDGTHTEIVKPGQSERYGLGCIRRVTVGTRAWYVEEITAWKRPSYFEYTIREASMPIRHTVSRLTFDAIDRGTDVHWTSQFQIPIPIIGRLLGARAKKLYAKAFYELLDAAKTRLETPTSPYQ
jgi:hypothetical protein